MRLDFHTILRSRRSAEKLRPEQNTVVLAAAAVFAVRSLFLLLLVLYNLLNLLLSLPPSLSL